MTGPCVNGFRLVAILLVTAVAVAADEPLKVQKALPVGGQIGQTQEVTLSGSFPSWPVQIWTDSKELEFQALEANGKLSVRIAAEAQPGVHYYRVYNQQGASQLLPFFVDRCESGLEIEPNDRRQVAQLIERFPIAISGCLEKSGDVDTYRVTLKSQQTLVASLFAQRYLAAPMDADLQILNSSGTLIHQQLDRFGLDPVAIFTAPTDGDYLIRVIAFPETPNSTIGYAGGDKFVYRLLVTTGAYLDFVLPAAVSSKQPNSFRLFGSNLDARTTALSTQPLSPDKQDHTLSVMGVAGFVELPISERLVALEVDSSHEKANPQKIELPLILSGQILTAKELDAYECEMKAGTKWKMEVQASPFGSRLDGVLSVLNADGKQLATSDDVNDNRDPSLSFTAPADGLYRIVISDLHREGSIQHWYRLTVEPERPDFELTVSSDLVAGKVGQPIEVTVSVNRMLDFGEDIAIEMEPRLNGASIQTTSKKGEESAKLVKLIVQSNEPFSGPIRIHGRSNQASAMKCARPGAAKSTWLWLTIAP